MYYQPYKNNKYPKVYHWRKSVNDGAMKKEFIHSSKWWIVNSLWFWWKPCTKYINMHYDIYIFLNLKAVYTRRSTGNNGKGKAEMYYSGKEKWLLKNWLRQLIKD